MRRVNVWVLLPAVLLALGVGVLVGRAGDDGNETASTTSSTVRTTTSTTEDTTTTSEDTTTTTSATTTTTAAAGAARTTTTVRASAPATQTSTETSIRPATTTPGQPSDPACGTGTAAASAHLVVTGTDPPPNPYKYSGPVTVTNNTGKAIELTSLVVRLTSQDGTIEDVAVTGAAGTVIENGASKDLPFSYSTSHPPKDTDGTSLASFAYKPPGGTRNCAST
ncbi:MAG: hypothetical protein QOG87_3279 [Actinomycetota bacterium]|jgi:cytoskeletal protein RodZ